MMRHCMHAGVLEKVGATVDYEKNRVTLPSHIVEEGLKMAPKIIKYCDRNKKYDILLEKERTYFTMHAVAVLIRRCQMPKLPTSGL